MTEIDQNNFIDSDNYNYYNAYSYDISVIIPIYKAELFIENCARSLFGQSLLNIEFIFIDDCSPDNSISILEKVIEDYPNRKNDTIIIRNINNLGPSTSRLKGLEKSRGRYVIFCDSDDWIEKDMYSILLHTAKKNDADFVWCDFIDEFKGYKRYRKEAEIEDNKILISSILTGKCHGSQWNKLVKRELLLKHKHLMEIKLSMWEDLLLTIFILEDSNRICYVNKALYHYNQENIQSLLTQLTTNKIEDRVKVCNKLNELFVTNNQEFIFKDQLYQRMLLAKMEYITEYNYLNIKRWQELWPESNIAKDNVNISYIKHIILNFACKENFFMVRILVVIKYFGQKIKIFFNKLL